MQNLLQDWSKKGLSINKFREIIVKSFLVNAANENYLNPARFCFYHYRFLRHVHFKLKKQVIFQEDVLLIKFQKAGTKPLTSVFSKIGFKYLLCNIS